MTCLDLYYKPTLHPASCILIVSSSYLNDKTSPQFQFQNQQFWSAVKVQCCPVLHTATNRRTLKLWMHVMCGLSHRDTPKLKLSLFYMKPPTNHPSNILSTVWLCIYICKNVMIYNDKAFLSSSKLAWMTKKLTKRTSHIGCHTDITAYIPVEQILCQSLNRNPAVKHTIHKHYCFCLVTCRKLCTLKGTIALTSVIKTSWRTSAHHLIIAQCW